LGLRFENRKASSHCKEREEECVLQNRNNCCDGEEARRSKGERSAAAPEIGGPSVGMTVIERARIRQRPRGHGESDRKGNVKIKEKQTQHGVPCPHSDYSMDWRKWGGNLGR
jgi:hypothetical protein